MKKFRTFGYFCLPLLVLLLSGCIHISGHRLYLETNWQQEFEKKIETKHFVFYIPKGDKVDITAQEQFYEYITGLFGIESKDKIIYVKCRDDKDMKRVWGDENNGIKIGGVAGEYNEKNGNLVPIIISTKEWENHELVHVLQPPDSKSTTFFNEGLAVAFSINPLKNNYIPSHRLMFDLSIPITFLQPLIIEKGDYISIDEILTSEEFEVVSGLFLTTTTAYLEAGSFVRYLIDVYGLEKFFQFLKLSDYLDSKELTKEKFLKIYDISIQEMEKQWLDFLKENY